MIHRASTRLLVATAMVCPALGHATTPPVEGDEGLLRVLIAAQETNRSLFPSGRMRFQVRDEAKLLGTYQAEGSVVWDDAKIRWEYTARECGPNGDGLRVTREAIKQKPRVIGPARRVRRIEIPGSLMSYRPDIGLAYVAAGTKPGAGYDDLIEVCPFQSWYRMDGPYMPEAGGWRRLLDPVQAPETVSKFVVAREPEDVVVVTLHFRSGDRLEVAASLRHGGNVLRYEEKLGEESRAGALGVFWSQGAYDWAQTADGRWRLAHMECRRSHHGDPDELDVDFTLDIDAFDSASRIAPQEFTLASLQLAPGTTVEETGKRNRTYRIGLKGSEETTLGRDLLERLGASLKESGFAAPRR